jgi:aspartate/methionine/tyrosine aminotransferase
MLSASDLLNSITRQSRDEPDSGIITAVNHGMGRADVIPVWSGEGNVPTPELFCRAAIDSLLAGETFYTWQRGIPPLREALARYHTRHYGRTFDAENFFVTGGGMQAIQTVIQMIAGEGDEIIVPTPAWPNYAGPLRIQGSRPVEVPLDFANGVWHLDFDKLFAAITPRTRAICINSPSNPLGWTASLDELKAMRDECRKRGLWIIGDEVYSRFYYGEKGEARAPSFLDICDTEERLLLANTFSKNWAMTGWRVGWLQAPKAVGAAIERIIQYNTSGTATFLQKGCIAALEHGAVLCARRHDRLYGDHLADHRRGAGRFRPWRHLRPGRRRFPAHVFPARSRETHGGHGALHALAQNVTSGLMLPNVALHCTSTVHCSATELPLRKIVSKNTELNQ